MVRGILAVPATLLIGGVSHQRSSGPASGDDAPRIKTHTARHRARFDPVLCLDHPQYTAYTASHSTLGNEDYHPRIAPDPLSKTTIVSSYCIKSYHQLSIQSVCVKIVSKVLENQADICHADGLRNLESATPFLAINLYLRVCLATA
jgi:hypothetical protein